MFDERFNDVPEMKMLRDIIIRIANDHPNDTIDFLADVHNDIGEFVVDVLDGKFKEWTAPDDVDVDEEEVIEDD